MSKIKNNLPKISPASLVNPCTSSEGDSQRSAGRAFSSEMICVSCKKDRWVEESGNPCFSINDYDGYICCDCAYSSAKFYASITSGDWFKYLIESCLEKSFGLRKRIAVGKNIREKILKKYNFKCAHCKEGDYRKLTIDHIKPYSKGGRDTENNLQVLCKRCNSIKGIKFNGMA